MRKAFVYSLVALGIGAWLYIVLGDDPGYILISMGNWSVESTLVAMVLVLIVLTVVAWGIYKLLALLNPLGLFRDNAWFGSKRRRKKAAAASEVGLRLLLLGHWQDAYKLLVENAGHVDNPVFNYLAASLAAWQRKDEVSWNYCLELAQKKSRHPNPGIRALKALFEFRSGRTEQSLALLLALDKEKPGSPYVLQMMKDISLAVQDWEKLEALLPELEHHKVVTGEQLLDMRKKIARQSLLHVSTQTGGASALIRRWEAIDKKVRRGEEVTQAYLGKLLEFEQHDEALAVASEFLGHLWSDEIVLRTGFIQSSESGRVLVVLEKLLKSRPNNPALMLSLGRASMRNRLWGQAREYFENAVKFSKSKSLSADANAELARLLDHLGEHAQSAALYRKALAQLEHRLPDLPMPD